MGATIGTRLYTWWKGDFVGQDSAGNRYFREKGGPRRWVIYEGDPEGSKVPPEWNAWLHRTIDEAPLQSGPGPAFELPHMPNATGTPDAYLPSGSLQHGAKRPRATGDYQAWEPE